MKRTVFFAYGVACHALFLVVYAWFAAFVGGWPVAQSIDGPAALPAGAAAAVDLGLLALFALQHSVMARPAFKRAWTRFVPQPIERSTYVLASCLVTAAIIWFWQPIDFTIWDVRDPVGRALLWGLFVAGWLMVPAVSLMIHHFDLFGTRQVWLHYRGQEYTSLPFRTPMLYRYVRHPLYLGWALAFWATPTMTAGHLLLAATLTVYMVGASVIEERDLIAHFGRQYEDYRRQVPGFVPRFTRAGSAQPGLAPGGSGNA